MEPHFQFFIFHFQLLIMLKTILADFLHLIYPHNCEGCGSDNLNKDSFLCARCLAELPETGFINVADNPIEQKFYGRIKVEQAGAGFYFTKHGLLQHLIAQLKYKKNQSIGLYLGKLIGYQLLATSRFDKVEALIPLPLNIEREKLRGYNQSQLISEGINSVWQKPILKNVIERTKDTLTQTRLHADNRWENVSGAFKNIDCVQLKGMHVALIDDVITTGASIESCGSELLKIEHLKLSVISVGFASL